MSGIGVPSRHLENFHETRHSEALSEIGKWPARGFLIFTGGTGSGKSFDAAAALHKYLKNAVPNRFDRLTWSIAEKAASHVMWCTASDIGEDREIMARAKRERLAVIDDIGGEDDIPARRSALSGVILKRHDNKLPTVITTPLTMLEIDIRYGGRVADRLTEDVGNGGMIIECGDSSMRNPALFLAALEN
jgi:DNA replication protein DnaC